MKLHVRLLFGSVYYNIRKGQGSYTPMLLSEHLLAFLPFRNSDPLTVSAFFSGVYSSIILPHWLPILSAFPETTKPQMIQVRYT